MYNLIVSAYLCGIGDIRASFIVQFELDCNSYSSVKLQSS